MQVPDRDLPLAHNVASYVARHWPATPTNETRLNYLL